MKTTQSQVCPKLSKGNIWLYLFKINISMSICHCPPQHDAHSWKYMGAKNSMSASPPCFPPHSHKLHWRHLECYQLLHPRRGQRPVHQRWSHQRITVFSPAKTKQPVIHQPLSGGDVPDKALLRKRF